MALVEVTMEVTAVKEDTVVVAALEVGLLVVV